MTERNEIQWVELDSELAEAEVAGGWILVAESAAPFPGFRATAVHPASGHARHVADAETFDACKTAAAGFAPAQAL